MIRTENGFIDIDPDVLTFLEQAWQREISENELKRSILSHDEYYSRDLLLMKVEKLIITLKNEKKWKEDALSVKKK
jgi:hypothetical protein